MYEIGKQQLKNLVIKDIINQLQKGVNANSLKNELITLIEDWDDDENFISYTLENSQYSGKVTKKDIEERCNCIEFVKKIIPKQIYIDIYPIKKEISVNVALDLQCKYIAYDTSIYDFEIMNIKY